MRYTRIAFPKTFEGKPRLNCQTLVSASKGAWMIYRIPVLGKRPMRFEARLPSGLELDAENGIISGCVQENGEYPVTLTAWNELGSDTRSLTLVIGEDMPRITPLMGWCSWNAFLHTVTQQDMERTAEQFIEEGLDAYGYQYINTDSTWQGAYGGKWNAIMPNEKFPDMKAMCDKIHSLGLRCGIYSTPMLNAWGLPESAWGLPGCTTGEPDPRYSHILMGGIGVNHHEKNNARQWAEWGMDYLKYDWSLCDPENGGLMKQALLETGRDFALSFTVWAGPQYKDFWLENCSSWRNNVDSIDRWSEVKKIYNSGKEWYEFLKPGHFFDLDMLEIGEMHIGDMKGHPCALSEDEQIFCFSLRAFFNSPIQISCDLKKLTEFEKAVLCNEEVIAINQNVYAPGAVCVFSKIQGEDVYAEVYQKRLSEHTYALAFFNLGETQEKLAFVCEKPCTVRDPWAKEDMGEFEREISFELPPHTARLAVCREK